MKNIELEGFVQAHIRGFGFVVTELGEKYFVPPPLIRKLLPGDHVRFSIVAGREPDTFQVAKIWLVERFAGSFLGVLALSKFGASLDADEPCPLALRVVAPSGYVANDVVRVTTQPYKPKNDSVLGLEALPSYLDATLVQVLGARTRGGFEQDYALAKYEFTEEFPPNLVQECEALAEATSFNGFPLDSRKDLRHVPFVTIDSATTQDFDDALYAEKTETGWKVLVAIADVSHYVPAGSALDTCAKARGTSVYLPEKTVPMLPKGLSNGLCALRENVSRFAVVLEITLNDAGQVTSSLATRAVIQVVENMTYDQVRDLLLGALEDGAKVPPGLLALENLYKVLLERTPCSLSPGLESPEVSWKVLAEKLTIQWVSRHKAHKIVECFMLLANQQIANILRSSVGGALFRHQKLPTQAKWDELVEWAKSQGHALVEAPDRSALGALSAQLAPEAFMPGQLYIRSVMSSATYDEVDPSHFSLGYETYTHFTSPIRRYADLVVHRLILGEKVSAEELRGLAKHCSLRSRNAKSAERHVADKLKKRTTVENAKDDSKFLSFVVSQTRFGLRAVIHTWQCVVNVSASSLIANGFKFDNEKLQWYASGTSVELVKGTYLLVGNLAVEEFKSKTEVVARLYNVLGLLSETVVIETISEGALA